MNYELKTFTDLYRKALHDYELFVQDKSAYNIYNFIFTADHLRDWAKKDPSITGKAKEEAEVLDNRAYKKNTDGVETEFLVIRELCNLNKHFNRQDSSPETEVRTGYGLGMYGMGMFGVGEPAYCVEQNDQWVPFTQIAKQAMDVWKGFVDAHNLL